MPGQLTNITFNGQTVTATLSTFSVRIPDPITLSKIDNQTVQATLNLSTFMPKWMPSFLGMLLGTRTITWNLDTGSLNVR